MIYVTGATYIGDYKIHVSFNNERNGIVDLSEVLQKDHRPIFKELQNIHSFKDFHVEGDTVVWSNGLDLAPEFLYERMI